MALNSDKVTVYSPTGGIATSATFTIITPKIGSLYAKTGEKMVIPKMGNDLASTDDFTISYGANTTSTVTYLEATTIPAGYDIVVELPVATYKDITPLTDNSGGVVSNTIAAVTGSYVEATMENQAASFAGKINELVAQINALKTALGQQNLNPY